MVSPTKPNTPPRIPLGQDGSWLPRIRVEVAERGGAQVCAAPFLDPFARFTENRVARSGLPTAQSLQADGTVEVRTVHQSEALRSGRSRTRVICSDSS